MIPSSFFSLVVHFFVVILTVAAAVAAVGRWLTDRVQYIFLNLIATLRRAFLSIVRERSLRVRAKST